MIFSALLVLQAAAPTSTEAAWTLVRNAGFEAKVRDKAGYSADIQREGMRAYGALSMVPGNKSKGTSTTFPYLSITMEIATSSEIDPEAVDQWKKANLNRSESTIQPHLGRTMTIGRSLPLADEAGAKVKLELLWSDAKAVATQYNALFVPAREVDGAILRFDDETLLKRADATSLRRVFRSWGWGTSKQTSITYRGWAEPFVVKDQLLWAQAIRNGKEDEPRRFRIERLAEKGQRGDFDVTKLGEGTFYDGVFHKREDSITIDLKDGLALSGLRRRILSFAAKRPSNP